LIGRSPPGHPFGRRQLQTVFISEAAAIFTCEDPLKGSTDVWRNAVG
jgi:hypothetical protein